MSSLISKNLQVGSDPTATNNFTIFQPATPDGTLRIGNGNTGITSSLLTLTSAGNFGIGTSSPAYKLHVHGLDNSASVSVAIQNTGTSDVGLRFIRGSTGLGFIGNGSFVSSGGASTDWGLSSTNNMLFAINATERMRLDAFGNLGLGTISPFGAASRRALVVRGTANGSEINIQSTAAADGTSDGFALIAAGLDAYIYNRISGGFMAFGTSNAERARIDPSGNLLVGTTSVSNSARITFANFGSGIANGLALVASNTSSVGAIVFQNPNGNVGSVTVSGTTTSYVTSSDYRLKNITGPITTSGAYIDSLNPVEGTWKADGSTFVGLIAHEVQEASRTPVATGTKDGEQMQGMDYSSAEIIANMLAELKSLRARVAQLEAK